MAEIDKSLPNSIRTSVEIDGPEVEGLGGNKRTTTINQ